MRDSLQQFAAAVQHNCHISDAHHGAEYGLCTYLMKMREFYRWEKGLAYDVQLPKADIGDWLSEREALWGELDDVAFADLSLGGRVFDPFAVEEINRELEPLGLVYSAGYGVKNKPLFFLGHLERREEPGTVSVLVAGRELARDLAAPAAMIQGNRIYIRRESFRRLLWEKLESWRWRRPDNALGRAFACYDFEDDLDVSLDAMVENELNAVLLHEQGEYRVGKEVGNLWNEMVMSVIHTPAELMVRAVRDHWADCMVTLPALVKKADTASLHFYVGSFGGMRKTIFPALISAYDRWAATGDLSRLTRIAASGEQHWAHLGRRLLNLFDKYGDESAQPIAALVEQNKL
ncbi:MAG: hypothetical protein M3H12_08750 [Chromatiales bacterium]|uniref:Sfum_1244 family protein n=1 Tax=endosymbiont of Lamellibrachia barhami TaxID=205975 RepID=UPI0015B346E4|nr:Sfum_1244 family protein [endosymbiont of Lamellibrachia barhami]MBA1443602.1 hypothetical protein [Gammaproteobacteria bacterium]